jgi:hypothetical protein
MKTQKYRVFDKKNQFHQSYDGILSGALGWATDCAKKIGGYVLAYESEDFQNGKVFNRIADFTEIKSSPSK